MRLAPWVFWGAVVAVLTLSLMPTSWLAPQVFNWWDKAQHALGFMTLGLLGWWAYPATTRRVWLCLLFFGAAIEVLQHLSGWRFGDPLDWLADALGVLLIAVVWFMAHRGRGRPQTP